MWAATLFAALVAVAVSSGKATWHHCSTEPPWKYSGGSNLLSETRGNITVIAFLDASNEVDQQFAENLERLRKNLTDHYKMTDLSFVIVNSKTPWSRWDLTKLLSKVTFRVEQQTPGWQFETGPWQFEGDVFVYDKCSRLALKSPSLRTAEHGLEILALLIHSLHLMDGHAPCSDVAVTDDTLEISMQPINESEVSNHLITDDTANVHDDDEEEVRRNELDVNEEDHQHTNENDTSTTSTQPLSSEEENRANFFKFLELAEHEEKRPKPSNDILSTTERPEQVAPLNRQVNWIKELVELFCHEAGGNDKYCKSTGLKSLNLAQTCCLEPGSDEVWNIKKCRKFGRKRCEKVRNFLALCFRNSQPAVTAEDDGGHNP